MDKEDKMVIISVIALVVIYIYLSLSSLSITQENKIFELGRYILINTGEHFSR